MNWALLRTDILSAVKPATLLRKQAQMRSSGYTLLMRVDLIFANSKLSLGSEQIISARCKRVFSKLILICLAQKESQRVYRPLKVDFLQR